MGEQSRAEIWLRTYIASTWTPDELHAFLDGLEESFAADVPELAADAELHRDLRAALRSQLAVFLDASRLPEGGPVTAPVSAEAHALARTVAQRGLELRVLSQLYHAGHRAVLGFATGFLEQEDLDPRFVLQVLTTMWSQTSELLNTMLDELAVTYTDERERLLQGAFASRLEAVREILDGVGVGVGVGDEAQASSRLGYPLRLPHTAIVAWIDDPAVFTGSLDTVVTRMADGRRVLTVPSGARGVWAWIVHDAADIGIDDVPAGVRIAVGDTAPGIDGFRRSHREAAAAQRIAETAVAGAPVTRYTDVEVVSLLSASPEATRVLVERELAGLLGADPASGRLRDTLRAVLGCNGNHEAAARRLGIHKNTVRYRMQRIEELLGGDPSTRRLPLELALEWVTVSGVDGVSGG
ncbi:PucR family transcriptional regulator [Prescottella subtropica]|uniref:PucR family transcriptional regulator n=1 Tax=Prescottella subtropica TaxID=2545757 RepID=UPI0010F47345|nr:helix-turn-helix domain-containing protein [Prescottella subtropica]